MTFEENFLSMYQELNEVFQEYIVDVGCQKNRTDENPWYWVRLTEAFEPRICSCCDQIIKRNSREHFFVSETFQESVFKAHQFVASEQEKEALKDGCDGGYVDQHEGDKQ